MGLFRGGTWLARVLLIAAALAGVPSYAERRLVNAWELHDEIQVAAGKETAVREYFPSFLDYQDLVMFHPKFGYYGSGRVSFFADYQTYPIVLAPYFGQMIAEQMFRMWQGMRRAGTLAAGERFTIAEFGAGNGLMAESILDYLEQQAKENPEQGWRDFAAQVVYVCYDRSPALSKTQRERNARFGKRFEAREGDATDPTATIAPGSLKGVVLSNELPDAFSVHKVILAPDGSAEVGYVAPSLPLKAWERLQKQVPPAVAETVAKGDRTVKDSFFAGDQGHMYLTRAAFVALLEALAPSKDYIAAVESLEFHELFVPASAVPEVEEHLRRYARFYATELAKNERGVVTYINLGVEKFVQGAGRILKAGYVITLDYGSNWEGIISQEAHPHFRTFGPAHRAENSYYGDSADDQGTSDRDTSDPYRGPTLNDMTTDVNFSLMAAEGRLVGLTTDYFGPQAALQTGTPIALSDVPAHRQDNDALSSEFYSWANGFQTDTNYKLMVQHKDGTDASYAYPSGNSERLVSDENDLSELERRRAAQIAAKLGGAPEPAHQ